MPSTQSPADRLPLLSVANAPRFLHVGRNDKRGIQDEMTKGGTRSKIKNLSFRLNEAQAECTEKSNSIARSTYPPLSFRAQSRNLTVMLGRLPFVRRLRSEISPLRATRSGRNDKRGWNTVDSPSLSFRAQSRNLTIWFGRPKGGSL